MDLFTSRSIRARLYRGIGGLLVLVATSSVLGIVLLQNLNSRESALTDRAQPYLADLTKMAVAAKAAANDERGYLLKGNPEFLKEIAEDRDPVVYEALNHAEDIYPSTSKQTIAVAAILAKYEEWAAARDAELKLYSTDREKAIELALETNRQLRKTYEGLIKDAVATAEADVKAADSSFASTSSAATWILVGFLGFALLAGLVFAIRLARSITSRLAKLTDVADKLSRGEVEGLEVDVSGNDEVAQLGSSMEGVVAAFQELFASSSSKAA